MILYALSLSISSVELFMTINLEMLSSIWLSVMEFEVLGGRGGWLRPPEMQ